MLRLTFMVMFFVIFSPSMLVHAETSVIGLSHSELARKIADNPDVVIIDVRSAGEFAKGRVPNSINIAHRDILENISLLDQYKGKEIAFYCRSGKRAGRVTDLLLASNFITDQAIYHLNGHMLGWEAADLPIEK